MAVTPTQGRFGSAKAVLLVDGYDLLASKVESARYKIEALQEDSHGLGDAWVERSPTGLLQAEVAQENAFFDTDALRSHAALKDGSGTTRVVCLGFGGNSIGQPCLGFEGVVQTDYDVKAARGALTKANAALVVSGKAERGAIIHAHTSETTDPATTEPTNAVDYALDLGQRITPITSSSVANPSTITCPVDHGLTTGDTVIISGHSGSTPSINSEYAATVTGLKTFTIPVNVTGGGTGGSFVRGKTQAGGTGFLQVSALTLGGFTNAVVKIRHSADGSTFADLITFAAATGRTAERAVIAGTVNRYLSVTIDFTGAGSGQSCTFFVGFARA